MSLLERGDLFGVPPTSWYSRLACKIVGAVTFHWGVLIGEDENGWITSESLGKGTSVSRFEYPEALVFRIEGLQEPTLEQLISIHSERGEAVYDMEVNFRTAIWFIFKHYLKIVLPIVKNNKFNCQEWVVYMASHLGHTIIPVIEHPYCVNLEKSPYLEYIGKVRQ